MATEIADEEGATMSSYELTHHCTFAASYILVECKRQAEHVYRLFDKESPDNATSDFKSKTTTNKRKMPQKS